MDRLLSALGLMIEHLLSVLGGLLGMLRPALFGDLEENRTGMA